MRYMGGQIRLTHKTTKTAANHYIETFSGLICEYLTGHFAVLLWGRHPRVTLAHAPKQR